MLRSVWALSSTKNAIAHPLSIILMGVSLANFDCFEDRSLAFPTCTIHQIYTECLSAALNVSVNSSANEIMSRVSPACSNSCKMGMNLSGNQ